MSDDDELDRRLRAVERALTDGDSDLTDLRDAAELTRELERLAARLDAAEECLDELDAATQALRGYVGNVRAVNQSVERKADAALAKAESVEATLDGSNVERRDGGNVEHHDESGVKPPDGNDAERRDERNEERRGRAATRRDDRARSRRDRGRDRQRAGGRGGFGSDARPDDEETGDTDTGGLRARLAGLL
jgi:chromosome segregation ATPase